MLVTKLRIAALSQAFQLVKHTADISEIIDHHHKNQTVR